MKVGFITLGCDKNTVDSERYLAELADHGAEYTTDLAEAEVIIVNTCGFIDAAKKESIDAIVEAARYQGRTALPGGRRPSAAWCSDTRTSSSTRCPRSISSSARRRRTGSMPELDGARPARRPRVRCTPACAFTRAICRTSAT